MLGMVSSSLHRSAPTDSLPGLDVPGDEGFKRLEIFGLGFDWLKNPDSLNDSVLLEQSTELVSN